MAEQQDINCYGQLSGWYTVSATFASTNHSVAIMDGSTAAIVGEGATGIYALWTAQSTQPMRDGCSAVSFTVGNGTSLDVLPHQ